MYPSTLPASSDRDSSLARSSSSAAGICRLASVSSHFAIVAKQVKNRVAARSLSPSGGSALLSSIERNDCRRRSSSSDSMAPLCAPYREKSRVGERIEGLSFSPCRARRSGGNFGSIGRGERSSHGSPRAIRRPAVFATSANVAASHIPPRWGTPPGSPSTIGIRTLIGFRSVASQCPPPLEANLSNLPAGADVASLAARVFDNVFAGHIQGCAGRQRICRWGHGIS